VPPNQSEELGQALCHYPLNRKGAAA
jgi:hypothetical protein